MMGTTVETMMDTAIEEKMSSTIHHRLPMIAVAAVAVSNIMKMIIMEERQEMGLGEGETKTDTMMMMAGIKAEGMTIMMMVEVQHR